MTLAQEFIQVNMEGGSYWEELVAGRYLAIVVEPEGSRVAWLITARMMTQREIRSYHE